MIRENLLYKVMSYLHIALFVSLCCALTIVLSGTLLLLPAVAAVFRIGREILYKKEDVNESVVKLYFHYLKDSLCLMKFIGVELIFLLNLASLYLFAGQQGVLLSVAALAAAAFLLIFQLYIAGYFVFVAEKFTMEEVAFAMILRPAFLIPLFAGMVLLLFFFNLTIAVILLFTGAFFLFALQVPVFIQMLFYRKMRGTLDETDAFYYLVKKM
ncbi:MAG: hypothetical protein QM697_03805 [Lachnospiraceae bacterium]